MSLAELIQFEILEKRMPMHAQNRNGVSVEISNEFFAQTGVLHECGRRVPGRAKRDGPHSRKLLRL